jgi:hypothetical protein
LHVTRNSTLSLVFLKKYFPAAADHSGHAV